MQRLQTAPLPSHPPAPSVSRGGGEAPLGGVTAGTTVTLTWQTRKLRSPSCQRPPPLPSLQPVGSASLRTGNLAWPGILPGMGALDWLRAEASRHETPPPWDSRPPAEAKGRLLPFPLLENTPPHPPAPKMNFSVDSGLCYFTGISWHHKQRVHGTESLQEFRPERPLRHERPLRGPWSPRVSAHPLPIPFLVQSQPPKPFGIPEVRANTHFCPQEPPSPFACHPGVGVSTEGPLPNTPTPGSAAPSPQSCEP